LAAAGCHDDAVHDISLFMLDFAAMIAFTFGLLILADY